MDFIKNFSKISSEYHLRKIKASYKIFVSDKDLWDAFQVFCDEYKNYINPILKSKIFSNREMADYIFQTSFKTERQFKECIRRSLFACKQYIEHYQSTITSTNIERYYELLSVIRTDVEYLVYETENFYKKNTTKKELNSWRKYSKNPRDIFSVAKTLFFIDDAEKLSDIYSFDVRPYSIFAVRQLIEAYGKDILGFISITDKNGGFSKKHLNSAWDFIEKEINKKSSSRITTPFDIIPVLKIQKWSNRFVHTTIDAPYYVIFTAIDILTDLFKSTKKNVLCYDNRLHSKVFANVEITEYNSLKKDFEDFVNSSSENKKSWIKRIIDWIKNCFGSLGKQTSNNNYEVHWKETKNVDSYIISL